MGKSPESHIASGARTSDDRENVKSRDPYISLISRIFSKLQAKQTISSALAVWTSETLHCARGLHKRIKTIKDCKIIDFACGDELKYWVRMGREAEVYESWPYWRIAFRQLLSSRQGWRVWSSIFGTTLVPRSLIQLSRADVAEP